MPPARRRATRSSTTSTSIVTPVAAPTRATCSPAASVGPRRHRGPAQQRRERLPAGRASRAGSRSSVEAPTSPATACPATRTRPTRTMRWSSPTPTPPTARCSFTTSRRRPEVGDGDGNIEPGEQFRLERAAAQPRHATASGISSVLSAPPRTTVPACDLALSEHRRGRERDQQHAVPGPTRGQLRRVVCRSQLTLNLTTTQGNGAVGISVPTGGPGTPRQPQQHRRAEGRLAAGRR